MTLTLDDVSCLLHLSIEGSLLDHNISLTRYEAVDLMVELLWSNPRKAEYQVRKTKDAHEHFGWLRAYFKKRI